MVSLSNQKPVEDEMSKKMLPDNVKIEAHNCGGVIVNEFFVLTAAHCVMYHIPYAGYGNDNDLVKIYDAGRIKVKKVHINPNFEILRKEKMPVHDIELLELESPIAFGGQAGPACLDRSPYINYGQVMITGFGSISKLITNRQTGERRKGELSRFLKELAYRDVSNQTENSEMFKGIIFSDSLTGENESSCVGDSGGPMHKTQNGRTTVVGVTSGSNHNIRRGDYLILCNGRVAYTRVSNYIDWIESIVGLDHC